MRSLQSATRSVRQSQRESPRTVLAFFATTLGLLLAFIGGTVAVLARYKTHTEAIPFLLIFGGLAFLMLVVGVFYIIMFRDPSSLMLGQVTGSEYVEIQRVQLGDSRAGERELPIEQHGTEPPVILGELDSTISPGDGEPAEEEEE